MCVCVCMCTGEKEIEDVFSQGGATPFCVVVYGKAVLFRMAFRCFLADIDGQVRRVYRAVEC